MSEIYDRIGVNYTDLRRPDPRIARVIADALGGYTTRLAELPVTADRIWRAIREAGL